MTHRPYRAGWSPALAFAAVSILGAGGCSASPGSSPAVARSTLARDTAPPVSSDEQTQLESANASFAFSIYGSLAAGGGTVVLSPYSISSALGMTYAGARTETADQMASTLDFTDLDPSTATSQGEVPQGFDWLDLQLASRSADGATSDGGPGFALTVANSMWAQSGMAFAPPFLDTLATDYGAGIELTNFAGDPEGSRDAINGWVSDETQGKIAQLIPEHGVDGGTVFVLVDAIRFDASWLSPFDPGETVAGSFTRGDGSVVQVPMMSQTTTYGYAESADLQMVELSYRGDQVALDVVVPATTATPESVTPDLFSSLVGSLQQERVDLTLPKFHVSGATIDLDMTLSALGMPDAFNPNVADFSGIAPGIFLTHVFHQAFIDVDEQGTEAAGATAVVGEALGGYASPPAVVTVNRSFFFAIRDLPTGTILFMGAIDDPS